MEWLDACARSMAHSGSRSGQAPTSRGRTRRRWHGRRSRRCGTPQGRVRHEHKSIFERHGPRACQRTLTCACSDNTSLAVRAFRGWHCDLKCKNERGSAFPLHFELHCGEPIAEGRAAQATALVIQLRTKLSLLRSRHGFLLAFTAQHEESRSLETATDLRARTLVFRDLTFDMSGGAKGAQWPLGRPLDEGVR